MGKIYMLEAYHFDRDYWMTIGVYFTEEEALEVKEKVEVENKLFCSIFEKDLQFCFGLL